jgi:hypothetical protein
MNTWLGYTPDGRELVVRRDDGLWVVLLNGNEVRNRILDVALIEAIRAENELVVHTGHFEYAAWVRAQAAQIEEELVDSAGD